jgi:glycosyltransferase involved in cell wall biosynthesis
LQDLADALKQLSSFTFQVDVVGAKAEFFATMQHFFADVPNVELVLHGPQPQSVVRELQYKAHIFCVPARLEALGVANMEAALAGTPIVSTYAGGIPEVLDHGKGAFLANPSDPSSLAAQIGLCIQNPAERAAKQAHAQAFVAHTFGKERMLGQFLELVAKGISHSGRGV